VTDMLLGDGLTVELGERVARFPAIWLRDNCPCPRCLDPGTGQKLTNLASLPADCAIAALQIGPESVEVVFAPDGHRSVFSRAWLAAHALPEPALTAGQPGDGRDEADKQLWQAADLELPERTWPGYRDDPAQREFCLDAVLRYGFVLLREVPAEPGMVLTVAGSFGYPRETNYGRLFDVRVEPDPDHLASTRREITPHTDNPYRDAGTELRASRPLIETSRGGQVRGVRFNNRTIQPLRLSYDEVTRFYRACHRWAALLAEPRWRLDLRLAPGDCLIFDNTRILHARTAFTDGSSGDRLLQGCYADLDSLASSLAVLRRGAPA
jgi:gamma-butyrobetaine dioxygenase